MAVADQLVATRKKALTRNAEDRADQFGKIQIGHGEQLPFRIDDRTAAQPDIQRRRGYADAALEHELPRRVEWAEIRDEAGVGAAPLAAEAREDQDVFAERGGL